MRSFANAIRSKDFVITASLTLPAGATPADIRRRVVSLKAAVDAVQIDEDHAAEGSIDSLAIASLVLEAGADPIVQVSCRDRNKLALRGMMLGARALGVQCVLVARGEKLPEHLRGKVKGVFDTTATQLIEIARRIDAEAASSYEPFCIGAFTPVVRPKTDWQADRIAQKIASGVNFVQSRPTLNMKVLESWMIRLVELKFPRKTSIIVEVPLVTSAESAQALRERHPAVRMPADVARRIMASTNPESEGVAVCAEALSALRRMPGVSGANIVGSPDPALTIAAIESSS